MHIDIATNQRSVVTVSNVPSVAQLTANAISAATTNTAITGWYDVASGSFTASPKCLRRSS